MRVLTEAPSDMSMSSRLILVLLRLVAVEQKSTGHDRGRRMETRSVHRIGMGGHQTSYSVNRINKVTQHSSCANTPRVRPRWNPNIGALIIRTGFWGPLYYNYNKEPPK